ncbi:MAG: hypothetical protein OSB41_05105 [Kiritimatiellae bacterium]|nr:hypothetical protein [Kiritimatiellia bacterium]
MKKTNVKGCVALMALSAALILCAMGCSKKAPVDSADASSTPSADAVPETFPITSTNVVVQEIEIPKVSMQKRVEADFNQDKLQDIALVEEDASGKSTVSIYLRTQDGSLKRSYYKAGGIRMTGEFKITALMSMAKREYTDLVVMQLFSDGKKERVFFRTHGTEFTEVERTVVK